MLMSVCGLADARSWDCLVFELVKNDLTLKEREMCNQKKNLKDFRTHCEYISLTMFFLEEGTDVSSLNTSAFSFPGNRDNLG